MRVGYARISQEHSDPSAQVGALEQAGCESVFQEAVSNRKADRPELAACIQSLRKGDTLVVWRLDRLGRSLQELVSILNDIHAKGVGFQSLTEDIDTNSRNGKLVYHIFQCLADFERNLIVERTKTGLVAARARGRKGGRKPKMSRKDVAKAAAMLKDPNITKAEVASHFGVSRVTLNAALEREGYAAS